MTHTRLSTPGRRPQSPARSLLAGLAVLGDRNLGKLLDGGLGGGSVVGDLAVLQEVDPVADLQNVGVVVGDQEYRDLPLVPELLDEV